MRTIDKSFTSLIRCFGAKLDPSSVNLNKKGGLKRGDLDLIGTCFGINMHLGYDVLKC